MSRALIERRLTEVTNRLARAREELAVIDEQLMVFADTADELRIKALVSDTPLAAREAGEAERHAEAMTRSRDALLATIAQLRQTQDELLEQLPVG